MTSSFKIFGEIQKLRTAVMKIVTKPLVRFVLTAEVCLFTLHSSVVRDPSHTLPIRFCLLSADAHSGHSSCSGFSKFVVEGFVGPGRPGPREKGGNGWRVFMDITYAHTRLIVCPSQVPPSLPPQSHRWAAAVTFPLLRFWHKIHVRKD